MRPELYLYLYLYLGLAIGAIIGALIGWLLASRRHPAPPPDARLEAELRQQLGQRNSELAQLREHLATAQMRRAAAEEGRTAAEQRLAEQKDSFAESLQQARLSQEKALAELRDAFQKLSAEALQQTHPEFIRLANETLGRFQESARGELAQRHAAIAGLVKPMEELLRTYQQHLSRSETAQATAWGQVRQHLENLAQQSCSLSRETLQLRQVLSSSQTRGRWGEQTLRRVVEAAGLSAHCDFTEQVHSGEGQPDLIIHLPGERLIIVDAKVPDLDPVQTLAADADQREQALATHAAKLRGTIKSLADRNYPAQFPHALDHVILFLPAESLLGAALESDRELILWAQSKRILLATPASFIATLRAVNLSWLQHDQTQNARLIAETAQEFYVRVCRFAEHLAASRNGLEKAGAAFNEAVGSYERMVRPSGERLLRLGGGDSAKSLTALDPLAGGLRPPALTSPARLTQEPG